MPIPSYRAALAAVALCSLPACKTERTVTWEKGESSDRLTQRFVGESIGRWEDGKQHEMDRKRTSPEKIFGNKHDNQEFAGNGFGTKKFGGTRKFAGNKKYGPDTYQFVRDREVAREEAAVAGKAYGAGSEKAHEGRRRWFGRDKAVTGKTAYGSDKVVDRGSYGAAQDAQGSNRESSIDILNPRGSAGAPKELSIGEVKKMLEP